MSVRRLPGGREPWIGRREIIDASVKDDLRRLETEGAVLRRSVPDGEARERRGWIQYVAAIDSEDEADLDADDVEEAA